METVLTYIDPRAKEFKDSLKHFMLNHSTIEPRKPCDEVCCMTPEGDRYYGDMDNLGRKMQVYLSECYGQIYTVLNSSLEGQPDEILTKLSKTKEVITRTIDHRLTFCENTQHALHLALVAFDEQLKMLNDVYAEDNQAN